MKPAIAYRFFAVLLFASASSIGLCAALNWSEAQQPKNEKKAAAEKKTNAVKEPPLEDKQFEIPFWNRDVALELQAALHCFGAGTPLGVLEARMLPSQEQLFMNTPWSVSYDEVIPLTKRYLDLIKDDRPLPVLEDNQVLGTADSAWYLAFLEALKYSDLAKPEMFAKSAERNDTVMYADLAAKNVRKYRGEIITVKGKLAMIRRLPAPRRLNVPEIKYIYTGWILGTAKKTPPYTIVFTELPRELDANSKEIEDLNVQVTFQGYFLSRVLFPAEKEKGGALQKEMISPYLVGKTVIVNSRGKNVVDVPNPEETAYSYPLIVGTVGGIVAIVLLGAGLILWYRSGDRKTHSQLQEVRDKHRPFNLEPDSAFKEPDAQPAEEKKPASELPLAQNIEEPIEKTLPNNSVTLPPPS